MNTVTFAEGTIQDLRHASRMLRLNPAFRITAIQRSHMGSEKVTLLVQDEILTLRVVR